MDDWRQAAIEEMQAHGYTADGWEIDVSEIRTHEDGDSPGLTVRAGCMTYDHGTLLIECDLVGGSYYDTARRLFAAAAAWEVDEVEDD